MTGGTLDPQTVLLQYLDRNRAALRWKAEDLSEYDARRPLTDTGTNLLGLVKHVTLVELGYFGDCLGRPQVTWPEDEEDNDDLWCRADETRDADAIGPHFER